ncbi:MAG: hypothetical protein FWG05_06035, partial [Kiritimatiellaeota bacterium]|nr:hypothetical protein [Kiritimatiellota bacterium]
TVGNSGCWNEFTIDNAHVHNRYNFANALLIGNGNISHSNTVGIVNGGLYTNAGDTRVGVNGTHNTLRVEGAGSKFVGAMGMIVGLNNTASDNTVELRTGAEMLVPSLVIGNANNSGNRLLLAGGKLEADSLVFNGDNFLAVEIQSDGLPEHAHIANAVTLPAGLRICPAADKDAPLGEYPLIFSDTGIAYSEIAIDAPIHEQNRWKPLVKNNTLCLLFRAPQTLIIIK